MCAGSWANGQPKLRRTAKVPRMGSFQLHSAMDGTGECPNNDRIHLIEQQLHNCQNQIEQIQSLLHPPLPPVPQQMETNPAEHMEAYVLPQLNAFPPAQQQQQQLIFPHEQEFHAQLQQECSADDIYELEQIIGHRINAFGNDEWHVRWTGYNQTTWEPCQNFIGQDAVQMLADFEHARKKTVLNLKLGTFFKYETVPGRFMVKRQTAASIEPQYLFAGQTAWTTNGVNQFGRVELDFATGTMTIPNFSDNDVGSYTFPLEQSIFSAMNGFNGCELQGIGCTTLKLFKMENNDE
ncbi:hypothetical protein niasHT_009951 [Heterodera trifolii]|uniref:Chromo domain-containing protein n=1 Tax=Heterodera trifolii TaxID=157864 RepID=A0ABD2LMT1_9BILA